MARRFLEERLRARDSVIMLAWDGPTAVGFMQLYPSFSSTAMVPGRLWILNDLYVVPPARGQGVAGRLLEAAQQLARDSGAVGVTLETAADNPAQRRYEALGWVEDREFLHYEWVAPPATDRPARATRQT